MTPPPLGVENHRMFGFFLSQNSVFMAMSGVGFYVEWSGTSVVALYIVYGHFCDVGVFFVTLVTMWCPL